MAFNPGNTTGWANVLFKASENERAERESFVDGMQSWGQVFSTMDANATKRADKAKADGVRQADTQFRLGIGNGSDGPEYKPVETSIQTERSTAQRIQSTFEPPKPIQATADTQNFTPAQSAPVQAGSAEPVQLPTQQAMAQGAQPAPAPMQAPAQTAQAQTPTTAPADPVQAAPAPEAVQQQIAAKTQADEIAQAQQQSQPTQPQAAPAQAVQQPGPQAQQAPAQMAPPAQSSPASAPPTSAAPTQAPATSAQPTTAQVATQARQAGQQALQMPFLPTGELNTISPNVYQARIQNLENLARQGKIDPTAALAYSDMLRSAQQKQYESAIDLQGKIAEISEKQMTAKEKALKIGVETRKAQDNLYDDVNELFRSGNTDAARVLADEYRIAFDPMDPKQIKIIEGRASRSEQAKTRREEARKELKEEREDRKVDVQEARIASNERLQMERMDASERRFMQAQAAADARQQRSFAQQSDLLDRRLAASGEKGGVKEANRIAGVDTNTRNSWDDATNLIGKVQTMIDDGSVDSASGWQNLTRFNRIPGTPARDAKVRVENAIKDTALVVKQALVSGGVGLRAFDSNAESKALEQAIANIDYNAGDASVRNQMQGIVRRMEGTLTKLNRARQAEGLEPLRNDISSPSSPSQTKTICGKTYANDGRGWYEVK